MLHTNAIILFQ